MRAISTPPQTARRRQPLLLCGHAAWRRAATTRARRHHTTVAFRQQAAAAAPSTQPRPTDQQQLQGSTVLLPFDFYACLGVTRTAGNRAVRDALDKALAKRPEAFFSADTVALRDLLLRDAAECLLNYDRRREYDAKASASGYAVSVSEDHLPGALVLLQECGANQLVLDMGAQWLAVNKQDVRRRDVTATMALAHHALAVEGLQQEAGGCMLEACRHLEAALLCLRQSMRSSEHAAVAADLLQRDVLQLLKDFSPDYCLALLALPLDDPQRGRGRVLLHKLLWELPDDLSPLGADKDEFMAAARPLLTAQEHLDIYRTAAKGGLSLAQQQVLAEALVALAYQRRQPVMMMQAAGAFRQLEQAAAAQGCGVDMCVEHACIAVLLGDAGQALRELRLAAGQPQTDANPTQQAAQQYVLAHCPDPGDLLPGMYALAQCWVQQGILAAFRQDAGAVTGTQQQRQQQAAAGDPDLAPWFDSPLVRLCILVLATLAKIKQCLQAVLGLPAALAAGLATMQQRTARVQAGATAAAGAAAVSSQAAATSSLPAQAAAGSRSSSGGVSSSIATHSRRSARSNQMGTGASSTQQPASSSLASAGTATAAASHPQKQQQQHKQQRHGQRRSLQQQRVAGAASGSTSTAEGAPTAARQQPPAAGTRQQAARVDKQVQQAEASSASYKPAAAAADAEVSSLVARARAVTGRGRGGMQRRAEEEDDQGPEPSPAARQRLTQQMSALEAQMWDTAPKPQRGANKTASMLLLAAALLVVVVGASSRGGQGTVSTPLGPSTLLFDARG